MWKQKPNLVQQAVQKSKQPPSFHKNIDKVMQTAYDNRPK